MNRIALTSLAVLAPLLVAAPVNAAGETCDGLSATIVIPFDAANPTDTQPVVGTSADDVIAGSPLADRIDGAGGNDVICGLDGADTITGGEGNDRLFGGLDGRETDPNPANNSSLGDLLSPGPGDDFVDLGLDPETEPGSFRPDQIRFDESATAVTVDLTPVNGLGRATGEGNDTIVVAGPMTVVGSPFDDQVTGSPYDDLLMTDRGSDIIDGAEGNDRIFTDIAGYDVMETIDPEGEGFASPDTAYGGAGDDFISGGWGPTDAFGGDGNDRISISSLKAGRIGSADGSHVEGGLGDDTIAANRVRNLQVSGDAGDDDVEHSVYGGPGRTVADGGTGDDQLALSLGGTLAPGTKITVDRKRARVRTTRTVASMRGFEQHALSGSAINWIYLGTNAKDDVSTDQGRSLTARTLGGRDRVEATSGSDLLDLGRGRDKAEAGRGRDTCISVEQAKGCEIRR